MQAVGSTSRRPLADAVEPYARQALRRTPAAGDKLVLATTTPLDVIEPVRSTARFRCRARHPYRVDTEGCYDGTIDGEFVWSRGKARMAAVWARAEGVDLADSFAYSDSIFDVPLLVSVGIPVAVNPDPRYCCMPEPRLAAVWFNAPPGVPKPVGIEPQSVIAELAVPSCFRGSISTFDGADQLLGTAGMIWRAITAATSTHCSCLCSAAQARQADPVLGQEGSDRRPDRRFPDDRARGHSGRPR